MRNKKTGTLRSRQDTLQISPTTKIPNQYWLGLYQVITMAYMIQKKNNPGDYERELLNSVLKFYHDKPPWEWPGEMEDCIKIGHLIELKSKPGADWLSRRSQVLKDKYARPLNTYQGCTWLSAACSKISTGSSFHAHRAYKTIFVAASKRYCTNKTEFWRTRAKKQWCRSDGEYKVEQKKQARQRAKIKDDYHRRQIKRKGETHQIIQEVQKTIHANNGYCSAATSSTPGSKHKLLCTLLKNNPISQLDDDLKVVAEIFLRWYMNDSSAFENIPQRIKENFTDIRQTLYPPENMGGKNQKELDPITYTLKWFISDLDEAINRNKKNTEVSPAVIQLRTRVTTTRATRISRNRWFHSKQKTTAQVVEAQQEETCGTTPRKMSGSL